MSRKEPQPKPTKMKELIPDLLSTLRHARIFITSRQKMHETGIFLYDELITKVEKLESKLTADGKCEQGKCHKCNGEGTCFGYMYDVLCPECNGTGHRPMNKNNR